MTSPFLKPEQRTIGIPSERLHQLRALAKRRGTTIVGVIEDAIAKAVEAGEIPLELSGFVEIIPDDDVLFVSIRGTALPPLRRTKAQVVAAVLDAAAGGIDPITGLRLAVGKAFPVEIAPDYRLFVGRHAKAVLIALEEKGEITMRTATTPSIAADFARLLRRHVEGLVVLPPELEEQLKAVSAKLAAHS